MWAGAAGQVRRGMRGRHIVVAIPRCAVSKPNVKPRTRAPPRFCLPPPPLHSSAMRTTAVTQSKWPPATTPTRTSASTFACRWAVALTPPCPSSATKLPLFCSKPVSTGCLHFRVQSGSAQKIMLKLPPPPSAPPLMSIYDSCVQDCGKISPCCNGQLGSGYTKSANQQPSCLQGCHLLRTPGTSYYGDAASVSDW